MPAPVSSLSSISLAGARPIQPSSPAGPRVRRTIRGDAMTDEMRDLVAKVAGVGTATGGGKAQDGPDAGSVGTGAGAVLARGRNREDGVGGTSRPPKTVRFKAALRNTVVNVMKDRGWVEVGETDDAWDFFWADVHWVHEMYDHTHLRDFQKINHFRNHYELTRKDLLIKNLKRTMKLIDRSRGRAEAAKFDFTTPTFVLPGEYALFQEEFRRVMGGVWIMKPVGKSQGKGIFLISRPSQISHWSVRKDPSGKPIAPPSPARRTGPAAAAAPPPQSPRRAASRMREQQEQEQEGPEAYVVQKYVEKPYLVGGKKFDIRTYVLVTSFNPLVVYIHRNGFCRFSNHQYSMDAKDMSNLYIHATNVAIQKTSPNYSPTAAHGCKWLLRNLRLFLTAKHGAKRAERCFTDMEALMVRTLMSTQKVMINDKHCFELYGYDILLDENLKPWLLEVNASPSLAAETPWDFALKHNMLNDMFDVVDIEGRYVPPPIPPNLQMAGSAGSSAGGKPPVAAGSALGAPMSGSSTNVPEAVRKVRIKVGGFDLVYCDGPVKHERSSNYVSYLGCWHPIPPLQRKKKPPMSSPMSRASPVPTYT